MFERTLSSLIKGLRSHRGTKDEARYIAGVLEEIREEVKGGDMQVKAEAVLKLTYLQMLGYPTAQASFHMLEVMASSKYHLKHVGYLAVSQCFTPQTDVLILATNMIKKDLQSPDALEVAAALNGLSHIINTDLASHLAADIIKLLNHTRPAIRKRAVLVLHAVISYFPDALSMAWDRLREKLDDPDPGVLSAAVNIVCELSRRDAKPFVALSPQLFNLLTTSTNNWMLIKLIKLFGILTPHEPRLVRKLLPPIRNIISTTPAMSLLYECIHTVIIGGMLSGPGGDELAETCVDKLSHFLTNSDQNLKYISLLALVKILPTHPHLLVEHHEVILASIEDADLSIRLRALDLLSGMATRDTFQDIVVRLIRQLDPDPVTASRNTSQPVRGSAAAALRATLGKAAKGAAFKSSNAVSDPSTLPSYRLQVAKRILDLGSEHTYSNVSDFEWYITTILRLALLPRLWLSGASSAESSPSIGRVGKRVADQIIDITARVRGVREFATRKMVQLLKERSFVAPGDADIAEVLRAAAWVVGEYCADVYDARNASSALLFAPLEDEESIVRSVPSSALSACVHNGVKVFAHWAASLSDTWESREADDRRRTLVDVKDASGRVVKALEVYAAHRDCEVHERATQFLQMFQFLQRDVKATLVAADSRQGEQGAESQIDGESSSAEKTLEPTTIAAPRSLHLLSPLFFGHALGPVAEKAQSKVPVPPGLDLYAWIVEPGAWTVLGDDKTDDVDDEDDIDSGTSTPTLLGPRGSRMNRTDSSSSRVSTPAGRRPAPVDLNLLEAELDAIPIVQLSMDDLAVMQPKKVSETSSVQQAASTGVPRPAGSAQSALVRPAPVFEAEELPEGATSVKAKKVVRKKSAAAPVAGSGPGSGSEGLSASSAAVKKKKKRREVEIA
ncbi:AP-3 complex subunit delta [Tilletia horrida]|nr:AP-3 complex subunit delta [Tilletia horrida]KAK0532919.1 AP-3 complex subunit delta [Tilletia horrida]